MVVSNNSRVTSVQLLIINTGKSSNKGFIPEDLTMGIQPNINASHVLKQSNPTPKGLLQKHNQFDFSKNRIYSGFLVL